MLSSQNCNVTNHGFAIYVIESSNTKVAIVSENLMVVCDYGC